MALVALQGPYNIVYQMIEGVFVWAGAPATVLEMVLPIILAASIPYLVSKLAVARLNLRAAILVALATPGWYAVYRLQADLHANLLALTLFLSALVLLSQARSLRSPRFIYGVALIGLASFTHVESTLFLVFVTTVSSLSKLRPYPLRMTLVSTTVVVPATLLYFLRLLQLLVLSGGSLEFSSPQTFASWITTLGPLIPFTIIGLVWSSVRPRSWMDVFASVWGIVSIIIGISQYVSPQTVIFAQRAIILFPTPLLAGIAMYRLSNVTTGLKALKVLQRIPLRYSRTAVLVAMFGVLALSWPVTSLWATPNEKVFLTSAEYQQLNWVSTNLKFSTTPIFMFNDPDEFAGGLAQLYDSWVMAKVGPHLSYLGLTDYLVQLEETPFSSLVSRTTSELFLQQISNAGIATKATLLKHPIIIMSNFYRPFPLPAYTSTLFTQVSSGVFIDNATSLDSLGNATLPLYMIFGTHSGTWGGTPAPWAKSIYTYEVNDSVPPNVYATFELGIKQPGTFALGLRYWDGSGNNMTVSLDGNSLGIIAYNNTGAPSIRYFQRIPLSQGIHILTIAINSGPTRDRYASLDYLVVTSS
jgi:hypothetical protein